MQIGRNGIRLRAHSSRISSTTRTQSLAAARLSSSSKSSKTSKSSTAAKSAANTQTEVFSGIKNSAASVKTHANKLASTDEKSIFTSAEKDKDTTTVVKEVKTFARDYNSMVSNMKTTGSTVNNYFLRELNSYASQNKTELEKVGIKIEDTGSLTIDEKTLEKASVEDLKKVFNGSDSFAGLTAAKCPSIEAKATSDYNTKLYSSSSSNYRFSYRT